MADPNPPPDGRVLVSFDSPTLEWDADWVRLDDVYPNLITSYTIDRGRQYELDRTDTGRATVEIADPDGVLDPTNAGGPFHTKIEPLLQVMLGRHDPVTDEWHTRFRGFVEEFDYVFDPSQRVNRLTMTLVDLFEILAAIEMQVGAFGDEIPANAQSTDVIWFDNADETRDRMAQVLDEFNARIPSDYVVLFSGNVMLWEATYSPGQTPLDVITEAADAEFPGIGNVYVDRFGRLVFHGRKAKFTPEDLLATGEGGGPIPRERWDWHQWYAGDSVEVDSTAGTAHLRKFSFNRGLSKVINHASATPLYWAKSAAALGMDLTAPQIAAQLVEDDASIGKRGIRSWSTTNLLTKRSNDTGHADSLVETKRFATYYVQNYKVPHNRITDIGFRAMQPSSVGAEATWDLLCNVDISDAINVTVASPGGGGFVEEAYFVEGVHEASRPLGVSDYDDVDLGLDLSPRRLYTENPWP